MSDELKVFTETFFKNLKADLVWSGSVLKVSKVPDEFESFFGKKAPYYLVFNNQDSTDTTELVAKGSFLLSAMTKYLDSRGQTTLIKLDFDRDYKKELEHYLKLKNSQIYSLTKKEDFKYILRFTFNTTFQYLNEREQVVNSMFLKDQELTQFNIDKYKTKESNSKEFQSTDMKKEYQLAREKLKLLISNKVQDISSTLKSKLKKEKDRISQHYSSQRNEYLKSIEKIKNQIINAENEIKKGKDQEVNNQKIIKLNLSIKDLESSGVLEKLNKEESFFLADENQKHGLNIDTKLINASVIYYPVFTFTIVLKNNNSARQFDLKYNPLEDKLESPLVCDSCKTELREITLCSSSHMLCNNCLDKCRDCFNLLCKNCMKKDCEYCSRKLCKKCAIQCFNCHKFNCTSHTSLDFISGKKACLSCLKKCISCNQYTLPKNLTSGTCQKCIRLNAIRNN